MRAWLNRPLLRSLTPTSLLAGGGVLGEPALDDANEPPAPWKVRTVWISDVHLGTPGCQADALLAFLRQVECETLYLVGDIVDGWQLRRNWYWPQAHNDVVQKLLRKARKGTRIIYVPGNHDRPIRRFCGLMLPAMQVRRRAIHQL